jgi:hypothetical protein
VFHGKGSLKYTNGDEYLGMFKFGRKDERVFTSVRVMQMSMIVCGRMIYFMENVVLNLELILKKDS